jgi:hypothetical protein
MVDRTTVDVFVVATVWLGLDHAGGSGPPLIFETSVYGGALGDNSERYSTEAEAIAGHKRWVEKAKAARRCLFADLA